MKTQEERKEAFIKYACQKSGESEYRLRRIIRLAEFAKGAPIRWRKDDY